MQARTRADYMRLYDYYKLIGLALMDKRIINWNY